MWIISALQEEIEVCQMRAVTDLAYCVEPADSMGYVAFFNSLLGDKLLFGSLKRFSEGRLWQESFFRC